MSTTDLTFTEAEWAREQTNRPLGGDADVSVAKHFLSADELPHHNDRWKSWDNYLAIHHAARLLEPSEPVMDAGSCRDPNSPSVFLPSLKKLGFTDLRGCNLDEPPEGGVEDGILYQQQDITKTTYPGNYFGFVACLSVIEHGVDTKRYLSEMARIIRPGGYLFTSFDYWPETVDTKGQYAFGVPIKIFNARDVMEMCNYAFNCGLTPIKRPILDAKLRPVEWMGMQYTFMNLLMKKSNGE